MHINNERSWLVICDFGLLQDPTENSWVSENIRPKSHLSDTDFNTGFDSFGIQAQNPSLDTTVPAMIKGAFPNV